MKPVLSLLALALLLSGCLNVGNGSTSPTVVYHVLKDPAPAAEAAPLRADAPTLLVLDTTTGSFYDTEQLVFSRTPGTRGQYQFARWTERPGKRFADLMRARLDRMGSYQVAAAGGYVRGDLLLDTELVELYHDAANAPGHLRLVLRAELVDLRQRRLIERRVFVQQVPLASYDAGGAAQGANQAVGRTLDELAAWLAAVKRPASK